MQDHWALQASIWPALHTPETFEYTSIHQSYSDAQGYMLTSHQ